MFSLSDNAAERSSHLIKSHNMRSESMPSDEVFIRGQKQKTIALQSMQKCSSGDVPSKSAELKTGHCFLKNIKSIIQDRQTKFKKESGSSRADLESSLVVSGNFSNMYVSPLDNTTFRQDVSNNNKSTYDYYGLSVMPQRQMTSVGGVQNMYVFKLLVIGDPGSGKTSLVQRYVNGSYLRDYKATLGVDFALKVVPWSDNVTIKLQLWDIAGQERFTSMTRVYYRDAHACVVMFDLSHRGSFLNALKWKKDLDEKCQLPDGSDVPCILLANKCDLVNREVEQAEIEAFCRNQSFIGWTETSVKQDLMVDESMRFLLDDMMARYAERNASMMDSGDLDLDRRSNVQLTRSPPSNKQNNCAC